MRINLRTEITVTADMSLTEITTGNEIDRALHFLRGGFLFFFSIHTNVLIREVGQYVRGIGL